MRVRFIRRLSVCLFFLMAGCFLLARACFAVPRTQQYNELIGVAEGKVSDSAESAVPVVARPGVEYRAQEFRDPFEKAIKEPQAQAATQAAANATRRGSEDFIRNLKLQGTILGGRFPQAIINNNVVKVGDIISGARILNIDEKGVSLFLDNRIYNISSPAATTQIAPPKTIKGGNE